jgi:diketogulonate reductase-like aldo/keto reductase
MRSPKQVEGVIGAAEFRLSPQELAEIQAFREQAQTQEAGRTR